MSVDDLHKRRVREEAVAWVQRLTAREPSAADRTALRAWLDTGPDHRRAYEDARQIWAALADVPIARPRAARSTFRRNAIWGTGVAASIAAVMAWTIPMHDLSTKDGEVRAVRLADGSQLWLDGASAVDLDMSGDRRVVRLERGRVAIAVAKDRRPFLVEAGGAEVRDIGTVFSVDLASPLRVAVDQGAVDVSIDGRHTALAAGTGASFPAGVSRSFFDVGQDFAWRAGRIELRDVPLSRALEILDRYYPGRILLVGEALSQRRVSGTIFAAKPDEGLTAILNSQGLEAIHLPWLTIVRAR